MSRYLLKTALLVALLFGTSAGVASAQYSSGVGGLLGNGSIAGTGTTTVKRKPSAMRMYVQLVAKGESLKDALAKLKTRRKEALAKLEELGAEKESASFDDLSLSSAEGSRRNQMQAMVRQRMSGMLGSGRKAPKGLNVPKTVTVSQTLSAEWPIEYESAEQLLIDSEALKEKITAADVAGAKQKEKLTPEQEELAEEMAEMMRDSGQEELPVGQPHFVFVARITEAESDKAMADAFAKAKANAARVAKAAGLPLGDLRGVLGRESNGFGGGDEYYDSSYERRAYYQQLMASRGSDDPKETIGQDAESLGFRFSVFASFALEADK